MKLKNLLTVQLTIVCFSTALLFNRCKKDEASNAVTPVAVDSSKISYSGYFTDAVSSSGARLFSAKVGDKNGFQGVIFKTDDTTGYTDIKGMFKYKKSQKVAFYIGGLKIGEATGDSLLTPLKIVGIANASLDNIEIQNIGAILQSLDSDNDPTNGITLDTLFVKETIKDSFITKLDIKKQNIVTGLQDLVEKGKKAGKNHQLVLPENATENMAKNMGLKYNSKNYIDKIFIPFIHSAAYNGGCHNCTFKIEKGDDGKITALKYFEPSGYPYFECYNIKLQKLNDSVTLVVGFNSKSLNREANTSYIKLTYNSAYLPTKLETFNLSDTTKVISINEYTLNSKYWIVKIKSVFQNYGSTHLTEFDSTGKRKVSFISKDEKNNPYNIQKDFVYSNNGLLQSFISYNASSPDITTLNKYEYYSNGNTKTSVGLRNNKKIDYSEYSEIWKERWTKNIYYDSNEKISSQYIYEYDQIGQISKTSNYNGEILESIYKDYTYWSNGNTNSFTKYDATGSKKISTTYYKEDYSFDKTINH